MTKQKKYRDRTALFLAGQLLFALCQAQESPPKQLSLSAAISFAMKHNPALVAARAEADAARAETGAARARTLPQLSASGFVSQGTMMPNILQSAMGVEPQALVLAPEDQFSDANLMLMAPLFTGGFLSGLLDSANARRRAVIAEASEMRAEVALKVREAYFRVLYGGELIKANRARVTAAEAMVRNAQAQYESGKGIEASVRRAEAELADAKRELTMSENERRKMLLDLLAEMGAPLESEILLNETLAYAPFEGSLESNLSSALKKRGALVAARERVIAAQAVLSSKKGSQFPQVYGFAMADTFSPQDERNRKSGYTAGIVASIPIFDAGMRSSETAAARAMLQKENAEALRVEIQTNKEVRQTWLDIETADANYKNALAALSAAQAAYDVIAIRVESGKSILLEQLDALATLTRAQANLAQAIYDHRLAVARLHRAVGETGENVPGESPR